MNPLVLVYKKVKMAFFNYSHGTLLRSVYADLRAHYGKRVRIDRGTRIKCDVTIGDYSYVNHSSSLQCCDVGKFCSISSHVYINPYNHNLAGLTTHPLGDYERPQRRTVIGNDVLISLYAVILEGIHIGDGAVIGAGAVVTHDVGRYEIWGGCPARFIRYRVPDKETRDRLAELRWWDMDEQSRDVLIDQYRYSLQGMQDTERN